MYFPTFDVAHTSLNVGMLTEKQLNLKSHLFGIQKVVLKNALKKNLKMIEQEQFSQVPKRITFYIIIKNAITIVIVPLKPRKSKDLKDLEQ